jgi:RNA polymerase sigma-70 factor (ECF subfamily)
VSAVCSRDWRPAWGRRLRAWLGWSARSLASIPLDGPSASQPRAPRPPSPDERASDHDQASDQQLPASSSADGSGPLDFDAFFLRYQGPLYTYLRRLLPTEESAIDLTQEAFFRGWTRFDQLRGYQRPEAWLFRVATNLALSQLRRREPLSLSRLLRRDADGQITEDDTLFPDGMPDLADVFAERDIITRGLRSLPERQRAALLLHAAHGFSVDEVAEALGLSLANTYQLLSRGARRFREIYDAAQRESER